MEPFFLSGEIGSFGGGLGLGRSSWSYWYGDGRTLDIPTIGAVKLPKDLVKPTFYPVFPGIFSHCSEESYHCGFLWALKAYQEGDLFSALVFSRREATPQRLRQALDIPKLALVSYNKALRRKRGRDPRLLRRIRYRRALLYDKMGMRRRYRQELGRLWEEDPHFQDLGDRMAELL